MKRLGPAIFLAPLLLAPSLAAADVGERAAAAATAAPSPTAKPEAVPAEAAEEKVLILVLPSAKVALEQGEAYNAAREAIEANTTLTVLPPDAYTASQRDEAMKKCAGDAKCFAERVAEGGFTSGMLLTISAGPLDEGVLLGMRLVDLKTKADINKVGDELPSGVNMVRAIKDYMDRLFPTSIWKQVSALNVEVDQDGATVDVGGHTCVSPCRTISRLKPGPHDVSVTKQGYKSWAGKVSLQPSETGSVKVSLPSEESGITSSGWFWAAVAVAAIGAGTATYFLVRPNDGPVTICIAKDASLCK